MYLQWHSQRPPLSRLSHVWFPNMDQIISPKKAFIGCFKGGHDKNPSCLYTCCIMTTYQHILIILDSFKIIFIWALFGPGTAVAHVYTNPPPSRGGKKTEATDKRLDKISRALFYIPSPSRGGGKTEATYKRLDKSTEHLFIQPLPPEEVGRLKIQTKNG